MMTASPSPPSGRSMASRSIDRFAFLIGAMKSGTTRLFEQLDRCRSRWTAEVIPPLLYEDLVADPEGTLVQVQNFLDLPRAPGHNLGASVAHHTLTDLAADQILSVVLDRAPWLEPVRRRTPAFALKSIRRPMGTMGARSVELTSVEKERAREVIGPEITQLESEWGLDTTSWQSVQ